MDSKFRRMKNRPGGFLSIFQFAKECDRRFTAIKYAIENGLIDHYNVVVVNNESTDNKDKYFISPEAKKDYIEISESRSRARRNDGYKEKEKEKEPGREEERSYLRPEDREEFESIIDIKREKELVQLAKNRLELQKATGELIPIEFCRELYKHTAIVCKQHFLSISSRIAPELYAATSLHELTEILDKEIRYALEAVGELEKNIIDPLRGIKYG